MPKAISEDLLILTKTYPNPSAKHRETTCVAALNSRGEMRRLYPVPFRFLEGEHQFQKWEWIRASLIRPRQDKRPESYRIDTDSITRTRKRIGTERAWQERREWIEPHIVEGFASLEERRQAMGNTLGFIRATRLLGLVIRPEKNPDWTEEDKVKLLREGLFDSEAARKRALLKKLPFTFYYEYEASVPGGTEKYRHMITDWEVGALFWRCQHDYGANWETFFRKKLEQDFSKKDLFFLMGTIHRFPDKWLIVGLVYPPFVPRQKQPQGRQLGLAL
jgi:hypothetical protein